MASRLPRGGGDQALSREWTPDDLFAEVPRRRTFRSPHSTGPTPQGRAVRKRGMAPAEGFVTPSARGPRRLPAEAKKFKPGSHRGSGLGVLRYFSARPGALQERARRQDSTSSRHGVFSLFLGRRVTYRAGDYLPPHYFLSLFPRPLRFAPVLCRGHLGGRGPLGLRPFAVLLKICRLADVLALAVS